MSDDMKIYTKSGDDGTTGLFGGQRVSKSDPRIDSYGTIDELNAVIGWVAIVADAELVEALRAVQNELFTIGAHLATPADAANAASALPPLDDASIARLERQIDAADAQLPPLKNFILPGGSETAARLHVARTVCRRAERRVVELGGAEPVQPIIVTYLNRLSDWLFVQARLANRDGGIDDAPWRSS
jgi:cob(I)alamin adenosyltransferase